MRVLVIGSEGNIGRPLVKHLRSCGHDVREADIRPGWRADFLTADITQPLDLDEAVFWADVVLLLSAVVSRVVCEQAPLLAYATNVQGAAGIARLCAKHGVKLVFFSTSEVYGPTALQMKEEAYPYPNNRYGLTKWLGEQIVQYEVEWCGLEAVILRLFMVYGEDEEEGEHRSAVVRFAANLAAGQEVTVHKDTRRSWLHTDDACRAIERAAVLDLPPGAVVNIGHPMVVDMANVAEFIRTRLDAPRDLLRYTPQPEQMTPVKWPDLRRQEELLDIVPEVDLYDGLQRVCARYRDE